ncbi:dTMP kinase [Streptosporangium sp. NPDC000239]|uniref:dTMP kinase n=1 Tax=unclassified Streptosporangium TaxID=2632669 RepID=UPI00331B9A1C
MSLFVTLDGPGGAGKSTLTQLVAEQLAAVGVSALATREPSGGPLGEIARRQTATFSGPALACLVAADRYHHLETEIRPALARGEVVVCDRYVPSSYVLQSRDGVPLDYIRHLNALADRPGLAVLVTAASAVLEERLSVRGAHSRFEHEGSSTAEVALYEDLADTLAVDGYVFHRIDTGHQSSQDAAATLTGHILELLSRASDPPRERLLPP